MKTRLSFLIVFRWLIFFVGILLGTGLTAGLTWANFEADFYGFPRFTPDRLSGFRCPLLLTPHETGIIQVDITNPTERNVDPIIRFDVSTRAITDTQQTQFNLKSGETKHLEYPITAENIDMGFFVFAKIFRYPAYPLAAAESTCGTLVIDLPVLNGVQIYTFWLGLSLAAISLGLWLLSLKEDGKIFNPAKFLAVVTLTGLFASVNLGWGLGLMCLALTVLLLLVMLQQLAPK